jgi:large subunit ribosomal protein L18
VRTVRKPKTGRELRKRRHLRVRKKVAGTPERPRLVIFRSNKHIYAHLVDDAAGKVLMGFADGSEAVAKKAEGARGKTGRGFAVGEALAIKAKEAGISKVVFDRAGYAYHGRVKAVADGARKGGLEF